MVQIVSASMLVMFGMFGMASADGLEEPVPIVVAGGMLDVGHGGESAPLVVDFDGDGRKDLLVGEFLRLNNESASRVRLYLNQGRNDEPRFESFQYFSETAPSRYLPVNCHAPQLADLDGDGRRDLITGTSTMEIYLLRGLADGKFADGEPLKDREGKELNVVYSAAVSAADWDGDGDLDLVAGGVTESQSDSAVYIIRNEGTAKEFKFAKPELFQAQDKVMPQGARPCVADWDNDGNPDMIMGCLDGSVRWYRNIGSRQAPSFGKFEVLLPPPAETSDRGRIAFPCVVDWNEDGQLDLLVGDRGKEFQKQLNDDERKLRDESKRQQAETFTEWAGVFSRFRKLVSEAKDPSSAELVNAELDQLRNKLFELNALRNRQAQQEQALQEGWQMHGRVWLLLRNAGDGR